MPNPSHYAGRPGRPGRKIALYLSVTFAFALPSLAGPQGYGTSAELIQSTIEQRRAQSLEAQTLLEEGDLLLKEGNLGGANTNYQSAYLLLPDAPVTAQLRGIARTKWADTACLYAKELADGGKLPEAKQTLDDVLAEDAHPTHSSARRWRKRLDDPEWFNPAITPEHLERVGDVEKQLILAKGYYDIADFDSADKHYNIVLRIDATNAAAQRGIEDVEVARRKYYASARDRTRATLLAEVESKWEMVPPIDDSSFERIFAGGGSSGGAGVGNPLDELSSIIVPSVFFEETTLAEATEYVARKTRDLRPGFSLNIVIDIPEEDAELRQLPITLELREIPISVLLDYITSATRTQWRTDDYSIIIEPRNATVKRLVLRTYDIPPGFINNAPIDDAGVSDDPFGAEPAAGGRGLSIRRLSAKEFLGNAGVSFPDGAFADIDRGSNRLTVRNTTENLAVIEALIAAARKGGPRNIIVEVRMVEVNQDRLKEIGFDWLLGAFNVPGNDRVFAAGGTQGNSGAPISGDDAARDYAFFAPGASRPLGDNPVTAGNRSGDFANARDNINSLIADANRQLPSPARAPGVFAVTGAFTDPQFQVVIRALNQSRGVDTLAAPITITRPGQRSSIEVVREFIYPTEYDPPEIPQTFGRVNIGNDQQILGDSSTIPVTPAFPTAYDMRKVGTLLEVEASIAPDGYNLDLNITPQIVRFDGFINYGTPITNGVSVLTSNEILQPVFSLIRESVSVTVQDGSVLAIGGLLNEISSDTQDKTPILGDIPGVGRLFQSKASRVQTKAIMFFVKARIIDPGGRPVNALGQE